MKTATNLNGHCAIVTGAAGGIGTHFCRELAGRGCAVIAVDLDPERLAALREGLEASVPGCKVAVLATDLSDLEAPQRIEEYCTFRNLDPDILVNNAGIFSFNPLTETSEQKIECFIDLHMRTVTMLSRRFAEKRMSARSGRILNMSSMSCWMPMPGLAMYAATKSYIRVFSRSLHYEMKDHGISVTVACPGGIATDLFGLPENLKRIAVAIGALQTPRKFARKAIDRMLKGRKQYINGPLNRAAIFLVGITPTRIRMIVKHKLLDKGITR